MSLILLIILTFMVLGYALSVITDVLNVRNISEQVPDGFQDSYPAEKYQQAQAYLKENTGYGLLRETIVTVVMLAFILSGGFYHFDNFARSFGYGSVITGLIFFGLFGIANYILSLPFSVYHTFWTEEKYGFNRTTIGTFLKDSVISIVLSVVIGGAALAAVLWFFQAMGGLAWLWCWVFLTVLQLFLIFISPTVIMPLFNKFEELEDGDLKTRVLAYADAQQFPLKGVYKMDGSKRSTKSNAFFTGFGKSRRIVLFDTLIERHTPEELLAVLAHEIGHWKKKHILQGFLLSMATSLVMLYILSLFVNQPALTQAVKVQPSVYMGIMLFSMLYTPIDLLIGVFGNWLSRKNEYEADRFAKETANAEALISALKKLSVNNLGNLTPHWFKVIMEYSHPPLLARIAALRK